VYGLREFIGDVEPLAPDVDVDLDPLLRREGAPEDETLMRKRQILRELLTSQARIPEGKS
jgi:hypothetical protein